MEIKTALDWPKIETELLSLVASLKDHSHSSEARKLLKNFTPMVTKLSKLELEARRSSSHSRRKVDEFLGQLNGELSNFEQWITMLLLY